MTELMFEPIIDEAEIQATLNGRTGKGESKRFLDGAEEAYQAYMKKNPSGHFILPLNEKEGTRFFGKNTDNLYSSLYQVLKSNDLQKTWRLVRVKKDDKTYLRLVHL